MTTSQKADKEIKGSIQRKLDQARIAAKAEGKSVLYCLVEQKCLPEEIAIRWLEEDIAAIKRLSTEY